VTVRFTSQGCKVETTCEIQPLGTYTEHIVLSVDPASALALAVEESAGKAVGERAAPPKSEVRVRATRHGFELVQR
jgi:hypothetical protein